MPHGAASTTNLAAVDRGNPGSLQRSMAGPALVLLAKAGARNGK